MRFLALSTFLFCFSTSLFADTNKTSIQPQSILNQQTTISGNQQLWLTNQIIEINKDIAKLETQIAFKAERSNTLDNLKIELQKIQSEQSKLAIKFEQIEADNNKQYLAQNDRISDIHSNTTMWGIVFTFLTAVIAIAAIGLGFSAKNRAVSEAKKVAEGMTEKWIEENETKIVDAVVSRTENKLSEVIALKEMFEEYKSKIDKQLEAIRERTSQYDKPPAEEDIKQLQKNLANKTEKDYSPEDWFDKASTAYYSENYDESILFVDKVISDTNSPEQLIALALVNKGVALGKLGETRKAVAVYENVISRFGKRDELGLQVRVARALVNKGIDLGKLDEPKKEIAAYENVISRFGDSHELVLQEEVASAFVNKAITLGKLEEPAKEIAAYEDVISRFGDSDELALQEEVAIALVNQGIAFGNLEQREEEIAAYENVVSRFGDSHELVLQVQVASSLVNQGIAFGEFKQPEKEIDAYKNVVSRFGDSHELLLQVQVALALVNQGAVLGELKQIDKAITIYESVVARFGGSHELALQEQVAKSLLNQCITLAKFDKVNEALKICDDLLSRFGESKESSLQSAVGDALANAVEFSLLSEDRQSTKNRIERAEKANNIDSSNFTVMKFVRFLIDDISLINMIEQIEQIEQIEKLPSDTEFTWSFDEIRNYLAELIGDKKQQSEAIVDFFENHHDIAELKKQLVNYL